MKAIQIPVLVVAASLTVSCVRQVRTVSGLPPMPNAQSSSRNSSAMERQVQNARDVGEGDYLVRSLRAKMAIEPDNLAVRLELIDHYTHGGYPELALEHCRLAATRFPESAALQLAMAKLLRGMKMPKEAEQGLAAFLTAHPQKSPDCQSWLGILRD
jgi:predicted Zn-dependent protease